MPETLLYQDNVLLCRNDDGLMLRFRLDTGGEETL